MGRVEISEALVTIILADHKLRGTSLLLDLLVGVNLRFLRTVLQPTLLLLDLLLAEVDLGSPTPVLTEATVVTRMISTERRKRRSVPTEFSVPET